MANSGFDTHVIRSTWGIDLLRGGDPVERSIFGLSVKHDARLIRDVQTLARVVLPGRFDYRLEALGDKLLGGNSTEEQRALKELAKTLGIGTLKQEGAHRALWDAYPAKLEAYGKEDVRLTYDLYELLLKQASPSDLRVFDMECEVQRVLMTAEQHGVLVDKNELALLRTRLEAELADAHAKLLEWLPQEALGEEDGPANQKALREGLIAAGVPLYKHTKTSGKLNAKTGKKNPIQLATNKDALGEFEDANEVIGLLLGWRKLGKILSTYVGALEKANPRVHPRFLSCAARTSRSSCREPNMQNLPRGSGARNAVIPAPGNALAVVDYDSIEVWVLGHYLSRACGNRALLDLLESGIDMHTATAAKVFGNKPPSKGGPPKHLRGRDFKDPELLAHYAKGGPGDAQRTLAKETTFSSLYGIGYRKLSRRLGVPEEVAKEIKGAVLNAIPGYWDLYDKLRDHMQCVGFLRTALWRRLDVPKGKPHINLNTIVQGSAAEIMKLGMLAAEAPLAALGYQIIMVVHDELVSEGPAENAAAATAACSTAMESVAALLDHNGDPLFDCSLKATGSHTTLNYGACK
jgi:DNA polymerase-1